MILLLRLSLTVAVLVPAIAACEPVGAVALYPLGHEAPRYGSAPWPSDLFLVDALDGKGQRIGPVAGLEDLVPSETAALQAQLSALDGFGSRPVVELFFDADLDASTVPARTSQRDDPMVLLDVDDASPQRGRVIAMDWRWDAGRRALVGAVVRGEVLEGGTRYAAVVTREVRAAAGVLGVSAGLEEVRGGRGGPRAVSTREGLAAAQALLGRDVVAGTVFTTQRARDGLLKARAVIERLPAPTVTFDNDALLFRGPARLRALLGEPARDRNGEARLGWSWGTGLAHDHVAALGTGTLHGVTFRRPEREGAHLHDLDSGTWDFADDGEPRVDRVADLPITFAVPEGPMPPSGWPVAFYGHGLGASRAQMLAFIDTLARAGWATVAIDADGHGSRHTDVDGRNNAGARLGEAFRGEQQLDDGFGDVEGNGTALDLFHGFIQIAAMRDQMRESVIDLGQVVRAMNSGVDLSALVPGARVDGDRIAYLGESFGGVLGALFAAVEPDVHFFYLDVPGGGVLEYAALNSPALSPLVKLFVPPAYGLDPALRLDRFHPLIGLGSAILDGADPLTFAPHVLRDRPRVGERPLGPRHLVVVEVCGDEVLPNSATNALALALGLPRLSPTLSPDMRFEDVTGPLTGNLEGQTAALVQVWPATHGDNWADEAGEAKFAPFDEEALDFVSLPQPLLVNNPVGATHRQVGIMLRDHAAGHTPTLVAAP